MVFLQILQFTDDSDLHLYQLIIVDSYFNGRYITPCMSCIYKLRIKYWRVWSGFFTTALNIYFVLTRSEKYYTTFMIGSAVFL